MGEPGSKGDSHGERARSMREGENLNPVDSRAVTLPSVRLPLHSGLRNVAPLAH